MTKISKVMDKLKNMGYEFNLKDDNIKFNLKSGYDPDMKKVEKLFNKIKENKTAAIKLLKNRKIPDWFVVKSNLLNGEKIFFRKNKSIEIPNKFDDLESYTYHEAKILLDDDEMDRDDLKEIHNIRKAVDGSLILSNQEVVKNFK